MSDPFAAIGQCQCSHVWYRMTRRPLIVHCCHCRSCQREGGGALVLNALIESSYVEVLSLDKPDIEWTDTASGKGQRIARCPTCRIALWSHYYVWGDERLSFVRVGTLNNPDLLPPDVHVFTESKQPWMILPVGARAFAEHYDWKTVWPEDSKARWRAII